METVLPNSYGPNAKLLGAIDYPPTGTNPDRYFLAESIYSTRLPFISGTAYFPGPKDLGFGWGICINCAEWTSIKGEPDGDGLTIVQTSQLAKLQSIRDYSFTRFIDSTGQEYFVYYVDGNTVVFDRQLNGETTLHEATGTVEYFSPSSTNIFVGENENFIVYTGSTPYQYPVKYNPHPIGNRQNLSIASISLDLEGCDFNGEYSYSGYKRLPLKDLSYNVSYLAMGSIAIEGRKFRPRYSFEWDLVIPFEKLSKLMAIREEQELKIRGYNSSIGVKLIDGRLGMLDKSPRQRAKARQLVNPSAPMGYEYITPVFDIYISDIMYDLFIPSKNIWKVKVIAQELNILSPNYDIV